MVALTKVILKKNVAKLLIYCLINAVLAWMFAALYPSIAKESAQLSELFANYPESFLKAFNVESLDIFSSFESFIAVENFSIMWPIMLFVFIISYAAGSLSGEIEKKTLDLLLAQPLSRFRLFVTKYLSGIILTTIFAVVSMGSIVCFAMLYGIDVDIKAFVLLTILSTLFGICVLSVGFVFSGVFSANGKTLSVNLFIFMAMYVMKIVSELNDSLVNIKFLSFFHYYDYNVALIDRTIPLGSVLVFVGVSLLCFIVSLLYFTKRDIAT